MVNLLIPESRNTDPVRFAQSRIRVFVAIEERGISQGYWIEEDRLFSLLPYDQKRVYLLEKRGVPICLTVPSACAMKIVEQGFTSMAANGKRELLNILEGLENV